MSAIHLSPAKLKTTAVSVRLPNDMVKYLNQTSKKTGVTKTDIISSALAMKIHGNTDVTKLSQGGEISADDMKTLGAVGVGSAAGIIGYQISKYVRKRYEKDADEGQDVLIGLITGLVTMLATINYKTK